MQTNTAIATLGNSAAGTLVAEGGTKGTYRYTVTFAPAFTAVPIVLATPLQGTNYPQTNIADTFAITVTSVTAKDFTVNVNRVDIIGQATQGWDQNLRLAYTASA
jgi:hypothetical protein